MGKKGVFMVCALMWLLSACRTDDEVINSEKEKLPDSTEVNGENILGLYLLCEGNMGSNKCTLDYLDLSQTPPVYNRNIYSERNPDAIKELGDVGNDIAIYGSRLWMVINMSNKVEVATAADCKRIGKIDIPNCRSLTFHDGFAYVSSFYGPLLDPEDLEVGTIYKVDTLTLQKVDSVYVGWQPEEMAIKDGKLYVANSGGYRIPDYDRTISVIDLKTFREERKIDVAVNLHHLRFDHHGQLWATSRGDYYDVPSRLYCLRPDSHGDMQVAQCFDTPVSNLCIVGDSLYFYGAQWSEATQKNMVSYGIINTKTMQMETPDFASNLPSITIPYGIIVHPITRDVYLMDAKNYVSSGELFCLSPKGELRWSVRTGDIPGHACWKIELLEQRAQN